MSEKKLYVNCLNSPGGNGLSWNTAFNSLQDALLQTEDSSTEIWVAQGTYYPTDDDNREISFVLKKDVALYGGFRGTEDSLGQRDWEKYQTILSGNIGSEKNDVFTNSYHVVIGADQAVLDGFIIEKGAALPHRFDISQGAPPPPAIQGGDHGRSGNLCKQDLVRVSPCALPGAPMRIIFDIEKCAGGGIYMVQGSAIVRNCIIQDNIAMKAGGIYMMSATELPPEKNNIQPYLENVTIIHNKSFIRGGGVCCDMLTHPIYVNCRFIANHCDAKGGGVYSDFACNPVFINCVFARNTAERAAASGNDGNTNPKFLYCTFTENMASDIGSALYNGTYGANMSGELGLDPNDDTILYSNVPYLYKCLIVNNKSAHSRTPYSNWHDSTMQVEDSMIELFDGASQGVVFKDPDNFDYSQASDSKFLSYGYDIQHNNQDVGEILSAHRRLKALPYPYLHSAKDGEPVSSVLYVKQDAQGIGSGLSWENAYPTLTQALDSAKPGQSIWVAKGKYVPTQDSKREASFVLKDGVKLYGGFCGNETALEDRNLKLNQTILSGDIADGKKEHNSYHVLIGAENALIDGFIISDGYANGPTFHQRGAGILCYFGDSPIITNCIFKDNYALEGAGIGCYKKANPILINSQFISNKAERGGAALFRDGADATVVNCVFKDNYAADRGGAVFIDYGACPEVVSCLFESNNASGNGGAVYIDDNASQVGDTSPVFRLSKFLGNSTQLKGGAIAASSFSTFLTVSECEFISNSAQTGGGGISLTFQVKLTVKNNFYSMNMSAQEDADIYAVNGSTIEVL